MTPRQPGRRFPGWLLHTFLVVIVLQARTVFAQAVISPWLATFAPEALDREDGGSFAIAMGVIWVLWSLTLIVLAVVGAHRRIVPLAAAVLVALGGLVIPVFGPAGAIGIGSGLMLWGVRAAARPTDATVLPMPGAVA